MRSSTHIIWIVASAVLVPTLVIGAYARQIETNTNPKMKQEQLRTSLLPFLQEAAQHANALKDPQSRAEVLSAIAMARAKSDDQTSARTAFQEAVRTADAIEDPSSRVYTLENIAAAQIGSNDRPAALTTMRRALEAVTTIGEESGRNTARMWIVRTCARGGDVEAALRIVGDLPESFRARALANVLEGLRSTGKAAMRQALPSLLQVGNTIKNQIYQAECLRGLAEVLAVAGDLEATRMVSEILQKGIAELGPTPRGHNVSHSEVLVLSALAKAQAKAGNREGAVETFKKAMDSASVIPPEGEALRSDRLGELVRARVDAGDIEGALQTADLIVYEYPKAVALMVIAEARAKADHRDEARDLFRQAIRTARGIKIRDPFRDRPGNFNLNSSECLRTIGFVQGRAGFVAEAIQTAETIEEPKWKNSALALIAKTMAERGEIKRAVQLADRIDDEDSRNSALQGIAEGRAGAGDMQGALEWVRSRATSEARANAFLGVARAVTTALAANDS